MTGHALFSNLFSNYRGILFNRVVAAFQPPIYTLTSEAKKAIKIPEPPKKPLSTYFRFLNDHRLSVKQHHPDWKEKEIAKQCALNWKKIDEKLKQKYDEAYQKDIAIYRDQHEKYISSLSAEQLDALKSERKEKRLRKNKRLIKKLWRETDKPKRPGSSFAFFIKEKHSLPVNKDKNFKDILDTYKNEWNNMTEAQKQKYMDMFKADQDRYNSEITKWEAKMIKEGKDMIVRKDTKILSSKDKKLRMLEPIPQKVKP